MISLTKKAFPFENPMKPLKQIDKINNKIPDISVPLVNFNSILS